MESAILEKNLLFLKLTSNEFKGMIRNADCSSYSTCMTEKGEVNLVKKTAAQTMYFHSQKGALDEAINAVNKASLNECLVVILYGIGLGYYYDALKPWLKENSERVLVIFDDNLAVINYFLKTIKATEILSDPQVIVKFFPHPKLTEWENFEIDIYSIAKACVRVPYKQMLLQVYEDQKDLQAYHVLYHFNSLRNQESAIFYEFLTRSIKEVSPNIYSNIFHIPDTYMGSHFFGMFPGIPGIICGAGPSLAKQIPLLKELGDKALIFAAGSSLNNLTQNGVEPHFGACIDPTVTQKSRQLTNFAYETPYFYATRFMHEALLEIHGPHIYFDCIQEITSLSNHRFYISSNSKMQVDSGFTSTHFCLDLARHFGCYPFVFIGVDLAYTDDQRYASGVSIHPLDENKKREEEDIKNNVAELTVKTADGKKVLTQRIWIEEGESYSKYIKNHQVPLLNATEGGMAISGVPNVPFALVAEKLFLHSYDIPNLIHLAIQTAPYLKHFRKNLIKKLDNWKEILKKSLKYCDFFIKEYTEIKEAKENSFSPNDWPITKCEKTLRKHDFEDWQINDFMVCYIEGYMSFDQYRLLFHSDRFTNQEKTVKYCQIKINTYSYLKTILEAHFLLIDKAKENFQSYQKFLKQKVENARFYSETQEDPKEIYSFQDDQIIIEDPELEISIKEHFCSQYIEETRKPIPGSLIQPIDCLYCENEGLWEGQYLFFYPTGELKGECFYLNNELHGPSRYYTKKGDLLAQTWFIRGKRQGKTRQYYASGQIYSVQRFRDGKKQGKQEYYYSDELLKTVMSYKDGKLDGEVLLYYPNGRQKKEVHFSQGKLCGIERSWNRAGVLISEAEFLNNNPVGKSYLWYPNGQLAKEIRFNDQSEIIECLEWDEEGQCLEQS